MITTVLYKKLKEAFDSTIIGKSDIALTDAGYNEIDGCKFFDVDITSIGDMVYKFTPILNINVKKEIYIYHLLIYRDGEIQYNKQFSPPITTRKGDVIEISKLSINLDL